MRGFFVWVLSGGVMLGCAGRGASSEASSEPGPTPSPAPTVTDGERTSPVTPSARRIYMLGEERYAEGRFPEAVALWGHAMLQLPEDPAADVVRHKLLTRMGHGLLEAYKASDDPAYLRDAKQMCDLYLVKHEALFGETEAAKAERGEVYELLYEIEWRLENEATETIQTTEGETDDDEDELARAHIDASTVVETESDELAGATESEPASGSGEVETAQSASSDGITAEPTVVATTDVASGQGDLADSDFESPDDGELYRFIRVRRVDWARLDDPRVLAFFRDSRDTGPSLLDAGTEMIHGPRVLVRAGGLPRVSSGDADASLRRTARKLGLDVIETARPALRRCYEVAMSRDPVMATRVVVELTVEPDGRVSRPHLVGGMLVDGEGDACLAQVLRETVLTEDTPDRPLQIAMPLQFFHEDAATSQELFWRERGDKGYTTTAGGDPMQPIDQFEHPAVLR